VLFVLSSGSCVFTFTQLCWTYLFILMFFYLFIGNSWQTGRVDEFTFTFFTLFYLKCETKGKMHQKCPSAVCQQHLFCRYLDHRRCAAVICRWTSSWLGYISKVLRSLALDYLWCNLSRNAMCSFRFVNLTVVWFIYCCNFVVWQVWDLYHGSCCIVECIVDARLCGHHLYVDASRRFSFQEN